MGIGHCETRGCLQGDGDFPISIRSILIWTVPPTVFVFWVPLAQVDGRVRQAWERGVRWALSMQNRDGGWSAFEKNTNKKWPMILLPKTDAQTVWTDPSTHI